MANGDERNLLECRVLTLFVSLAIAWLQLLNGGLRWK
jgi:hypothetical protein